MRIAERTGKPSGSGGRETGTGEKQINASGGRTGRRRWEVKLKKRSNYTAGDITDQIITDFRASNPHAGGLSPFKPQPV